MLVRSLFFWLLEPWLRLPPTPGSSGKKTNSDTTATKTQEKRISVQVYNRGQTSQDLKVEGKVYTVPAHQTLTIKAPLGTAVYVDSTGSEYQKGEVLFTFMPAMKDATVKFN